MLVDQGGHWLITHDSAMAELDVFWHAATATSSEQRRMNWTKLSVAITPAATLIASSATAYADPVPTTDEVLAVLAGLTDPNIPAANKTNIVTPGFAPDKAGTIDDHLNCCMMPTT